MMRLKVNALKLTAVFALGMIVSTAPVSAQATFAGGTANAFQAGGIVDGRPVIFGPVVSVTGEVTSNSSPPSFTQTDSVDSFNSFGSPFEVMTGSLAAFASGEAKAGLADVDARIDMSDVNLRWGPIVLSADSLSTEVKQSLGGPVVGVSGIVNLAIDVSGSPITVPASPTANDVILDDVDGVTITLNQETPDGLFNAVAIEIFTPPGFNGSIDVAQVIAGAGFVPPPAIPEPSTWAMMLVGLAGLGFVAYCRAKSGPGSIRRLILTHGKDWERDRS